MDSFDKVFRGTAFSSKSPKEVNIFKDYLFCLDAEGKIQRSVSPQEKVYQEILDAYTGESNFFVLEEGQYFLPGFIDLHIHAPQWAQAGLAMAIPLEDWLDAYTFPLEAKFSDLSFAREIYEDLVATLLANGTTTALYFATVHKEASYLLAQICAEKGQRGLVGKVVMDHTEECPAYYRDKDTQKALDDTEAFILSVQELNKITKQGVYPVITPRFIPSCTEEALAGLGKLAEKYDAYIQSHCSESDWEHAFVKERLHKHDAFALNDFGLLRDKAVMAHCTFLADEDVALFAETGTAIAHCPISNVFFSNGILPLARFKAKGVDIGLGTDISGGFSPSLLDNVKQAVISSRMLEEGVDATLPAEERGVPDSRITINEAFYFATAGGGESLSLPIGRIEEGYCWDVQVIDIKTPGSKLRLFGRNVNLEEVLQKILYLSTPENIRAVWVQGEKVHARPR
ncbi:amidohydrolase 1 [Trichococcus palustris]|uniref:Guanine deaminase n=1 Tax=Trichococcus palustris TaxID=140314 RepID=A0A143YI03_9LACT|nr:guanine deaminase [Trichococcus palustris]CZQ90515.1 amidohydrolase 1 [Trichococcus palustris]SFL16916.1 guanine deaminase [Trichococcus palustris]